MPSYCIPFEWHKWWVGRGDSFSTDECLPDENYIKLERSNTEQSEKSTVDEIHNDI